MEAIKVGEVLGVRRQLKTEISHFLHFSREILQLQRKERSEVYTRESCSSVCRNILEAVRVNLTVASLLGIPIVASCGGYSFYLCTCCPLPKDFRFFRTAKFKIPGVQRAICQEVTVLRSMKRTNARNPLHFPPHFIFLFCNPFF